MWQNKDYQILWTEHAQTSLLLLAGAFGNRRPERG